MRTPEFVFDYEDIRKNIASLCESGGVSFVSDRYIRNYYLTDGPLVWLSRCGVDSRADTVLLHLRELDSIGFARNPFFFEVIEADLERMRNLRFDSGQNTINKVAARLELNLTRAFLKYVTGSRFGFVNPLYIFNRLDSLDNSTPKNPSFRRLFDVNIQRPDDAFFAMALRQVHNDSISSFIRQIQPDDSLYYRLRRELKSASNADYRMKVICNMERCRWRGCNEPEIVDGRYIVVNIPAYHLYAFGGDSVLDMRVGCGTRKTKTPLLTSSIERMEVNPVWNIPVSILRKEVAVHAGDADYFERNRYFIVNRETRENIEPADVTAAMLKSGNYRVAQEGGEGNSMGRIVFRFPNNFSVFLHDTSSKSVFSRTNRGVSHGCVRVQRPFDLAHYLLGNPDEWLLDRLRISMDIKPETDRGRRYISDENHDRRLVHSLKVQPTVPLFITYYTIYPDLSGRLIAYPDVYGYDGVICKEIKPFLQ